MGDYIDYYKILNTFQDENKYKKFKEQLIKERYTPFIEIIILKIKNEGFSQTDIDKFLLHGIHGIFSKVIK